MQNEIQEIYKLIRLNKLKEAENLVITNLKKNNSEYNFIYGLILVQKKIF
jgi:hypothetical protein